MTNLEDLKDLMTACVEAGYMMAQKDLTPEKGAIRKRDAEELIKRHGFQKVMLSRWVADGQVAEIRGEKNSPIRYSTMDILNTIGAIRLHKCLN